jgi:hypothetical protein
MEHTTPKNVLSVREVNVSTGEIIKEYQYEGYFDVSKRQHNINKIMYVVKNKQHVFFNGIHVIEITKLMNHLAENKNVNVKEFTDLQLRIMQIIPIFVKYKNNIAKMNVIKDIQDILRMSKEYKSLQNKKTNKFINDISKDEMFINDIVTICVNQKKK